MDGVLLLDKPAGMTSHDCVNIVRKVLKTKKVGHTGTLDPSVTGVLPICVGRATKISQFLTANEKATIALFEHTFLKQKDLQTSYLQDFFCDNPELLLSSAPYPV